MDQNRLNLATCRSSLDDQPHYYRRNPDVTRRRRLARQALLLLTLICAATSPAAAADNSAPASAADPQTLFEAVVRPALLERCSSCHSRAAGKTKAGLSVDALADLLQGGDSGPAVVPGHPERSLLVQAIGWSDDTLKMPPKDRLTRRQVEGITAWIAAGAPWPGSDTVATTRPAATGLDIAARKASHWAWQPIRQVPPPAVKDADWPAGDIDRYVLARLEAAGLRPAEPAAKRTLIRRLSFDLIGLPPTADEVRAFLADTSPDATERLVERLLASPRFGERWGRHWLDLVRYADTAGQEHDDPIEHAWRYRDYVIRAFNDDVPYDQLVREHLAGDLLTQPRVNSATGTNESILGTAFWFLGEAGRAPTDVRYDQFFRTDNQIDTLGKAFLGLPLGCAQCHDHKFDPIPQADYYALWGFAESTRRQEALLDPHGQIAAAARRTATLREKGNRIVADATAGEGAGTACGGAGRDNQPAPPPRGTDWVADFRSATSYDGWFATGEAFGSRPVRAGEWNSRSGEPTLFAAGAAHSGVGGERFAGVLRSKSFILTRPTLLYRIAGRGAKVRLIIDGYTQDQFDPLLFRGASFTVDDEQMHWHRQAQDVSRYVGERAHIELIDDGEGWVRVEQVLLADADATSPDTADSDTAISVSPRAAARLADLSRQIDAIATAAPAPVRALAAADGDGWDEHVLLRGNHKSPGPLAPRRFLQALSPAEQAPIGTGTSGRLELARRLTDPVANPLFARVVVNRVWHHLFGRGIVASTDNFGVLGERPSHPELLDHLATRFIDDGWSIKRLIRSIVLSRTYQMSSEDADPQAADRIDPGNELLHRARIRRLQAEAVRDALLAVAGELDVSAGGPGVDADTAAPAAGSNRRSVYLAVRRSVPVPLLKAFDAPWPYYALGRRDVSNVPAQALILMNDPFVHRLARAWAIDVVRRTPDNDPERRLTRMYESAFARPPTEPERIAAKAFLQAQTADLEAATGRSPNVAGETAAWVDLAHALMNAKEFIYID